MKNKIFLIIFTIIYLVISPKLYSYQDKDFIRIKLNQARNFERRKKFNIAETMYQELNLQFPHNQQVIQNLSSFYLNQKNFEKLKVLLDIEANYLSQEFISLIRVEMYIKMNNRNNAEKEASNLINRNKKNLNLYHKIALIYRKNSLFDKALDLYKSARKLSKNPKLYALEMAMLYQYQMNFQMAIDEYLNMLNKNSYNHVKYRLEKLNISNEVIINALNQRLNISQNNLIKSLLGEFLLRDKDYDQAFDIFKDLGEDALIKFAVICEKQGLFSLSIKSYETIIQNTSNLLLQLLAYNKVGNLYYKLHEYDSAYNKYKNIIDLYNNIKGNISYDILINALSNLAKIELFQNSSPEKAQKYIKEAQKFAFHPKYSTNLSILLADSYLYDNHYEDAVSIYENILKSSKLYDSIYSLIKYKLFLTYIFSHQFTQSDSLLKNYMTHNEESTYLNDMITLNKLFILSKNVSVSNDSINIENEIVNFLKSITTSNITETELIYENIISSCSDSIFTVFLKTKMADYYFENLQYYQSLNIFLELANENNSIYNDYFKKRIGDCHYNLENYELAIENYKRYLIDFPNGSYAPEVRNRLKEL
ncbi:MAG: hypothetical protein KAW87_01055 [Candidatus Cloacimonetes bacterium]|nr:hypothetical protein [Candidatus Cloacimonadota bacterium]